MHTANLTFRDLTGEEYTRSVSLDASDMFYAVLTGTIDGNLAAGSVLVKMERIFS